MTLGGNAAPPTGFCIEGGSLGVSTADWAPQRGCNADANVGTSLAVKGKCVPAPEMKGENVVLLILLI